MAPVVRSPALDNLTASGHRRQGDLRAGWPKEWPDVEPSAFTVPPMAGNHNRMQTFGIFFTSAYRFSLTEALRLEVSLRR